MSFSLRLFTFTFLLGIGLQTFAGESKLMKVIPEGVVLPETEFSDGRRPIKLSSYKGQYILVNFWATWCSPCVSEMPALDRLASKLQKKGVIVVGLSQDEGGKTQVQPFLEKLNLTKMQILYDPDKKAFRDYGLRGLPTTILVSPEGKIIARLEGAAAWDKGSLAEQVIKLTKLRN
jgi:thiol-disulfide isomerase/thioredoxin